MFVLILILIFLVLVYYGTVPFIDKLLFKLLGELYLFAVVISILVCLLCIVAKLMSVIIR